MLKPEQLAHCADSMVELYSQLNETIIRDVARRIAKTATVTDTGKLQFRALQNLGVLQQDVVASVAKYNNMSEEELQKIFADASASAVEYDSKIYRANGLNPLPVNLSPTAMQILEAGYNKTKGNITNLTGTTAGSTQTKFINACTMAEMKAESGAFTPAQAIFEAVKELASEGATVIYPSGHEDKIDVAVRRNVMTGIGQTTGEICLSYAKELDCDLMEITVHAGARPSHAAWQGKIVSLSGRDGYLSLTDIGYGTGAGFKGWNCRHDWYPYFEGSPRMYSDNELAALEEKNIEFPDGSMHTLYEAEQYQRGLERKIRESKRILAAKDELIKNCSEDLSLGDLQRQFDKYSVKLKSQEAQLKAFCKKTDVQPDSSRTRTFGFGKSVSQKSVQREKAIFKDYQYYLGEHASAKNIDQFRSVYQNNKKEYNLYRRVANVNSMYKADFGNIEPYKIYELDQAALREKRLNFTSDFKKSGNIAVMEYDGQYYFAHSLANSSHGIETPAYAKYKGDKSHLAVTSEIDKERNFGTFEVNQSDGKKFSGNFADIRKQTFLDTEAKLFESLENMWYTDFVTEINILSERGMCDSCKSVAEQFIAKHPEAKVNIVSGRQNTGNPWKGRKYHA